MTRRAIRHAGVVAVAVCGGAVLAGCVQAEGMVMYGTAKSVAVRYTGDLDNAVRPARQYCAQYGRDAVYISTADILASFDCVPR